VTRTLVRQLLQTKRVPSSKKNKGHKKEGWVDPRGGGAKISQGVDKGGHRKKLKSSAQQGESISKKNPHAPNPTVATDDKSGECE
jgi:hypothetical protein